MNSEISNLRLERVIAHQIFQLDEEREVISPKYSEEFTVLDVDGANTLQERIVAVLGKDSHSIEMSIHDDGEYSAYKMISPMIDSDDDLFKYYSQRLTDKLARAQTSRRIPGGIVLFFSGFLGPESNRFLGIIKAELHGGFSLQEDFNQLVLKFINDLLLTPQQKLYKIALFIIPNLDDQPITPADFQVLVYDHNVARYETKQAAQYFYGAFLGCEIAPSDKKLTRDFFITTKEFIDKFIVQPENRLDLNTALHAYLKVDQANLISVAEFANRYLDVSLRDSYLDFMFIQGFPEAATEKDTTYIKNNLKHRNLKFSSDVKIVAPSDNFRDVVSILSKENGHTLVQIKGQIERDD